MRISNWHSDLCEHCHQSKIIASRSSDPDVHGINHPLATHLKPPPDPKTKLGYPADKDLQKGLPDTLVATGAVLGHKDKMICQTCHQIHGGQGEDLLALPKKQGEICAQCHKRQASKDKKEARRKGVHPVNEDLEEPVILKDKKIVDVTCMSCHNVHDGTFGTELFPDGIEQAEKICVDCHERQHAKNEKDALKKGVHPVNVKLDEPVKIGDKKIKKIGCLTCHAVHSGKPNTPALVQNHTNGELCENCHEGKQHIVGTDHDLRVTAKKSENHFEESPEKAGVCGSCHSMHRGKAKLPYQYAAEIKAKQKREKTSPSLKTDEMCLNCHQKKGIAKDKPILHYGHPYKDIVLRSDPKIMPLLGAKERPDKKGFGNIACITCHEPHTWNPDTHGKKPPKKLPDISQAKNIEGTVLNSFLRRKGPGKTFCVDCHGFEVLPKYKYFHHKDKVRDIGVDYLE